MAGGLGTRLRPLTCNLPKPMVPVMNRPILEHTIQLLKKHEITDIVLLLFYLPQEIQAYFGDGTKFGMNIEYVRASEDFGTAGAVKLAEKFIDDTCLVVSGDAITDIDLLSFIDSHNDQGGLITLALSQETNPSPFGIAITDKNHRITRFLEKPSWGQIFSDTVNMGIYVMEPDLLQHIPDGIEYYFAKDLFPKLLRERRDLFGFVTDCYWKDIGDLRTYQQVHRDALENLLRLQIDGQFKDGLWRGKNCKIGKGAKFDGSVILGENCKIGNGAILQNSVIGDDCEIGPNSVLRNVIIWNNVMVGADCELTNNVVASHSAIGDRVFVDENVFISERTSIGSESRINANVKIWPHKEVEFGSIVNASLVWGDKWQRELFTNSRVTGLANFEVSPEFGAKLGAAFGAWLGKHNYVLVSRDATPAARMIYRAIISGLMSAGVHVENLQVMPIPIVRYTLRTTRDRGGVHIRRSPYEKMLMDVLFFAEDGRDFPAGATKSVERLFHREDFERVEFDDVGDIDYPVRIIQSYVQDFLDHIDTRVIESAKPKIVIDYSFGAATQVFPSILGSLDCDVISLNAFLDPKKLTRTTRGFQLALNQLSKIVKSTNADIGFLIDAGAEKLFCVDEKGEIISGERLAVLITKLFLKTDRPAKMAAPVCGPSQLDTLAKEHNIELICTPDDPGSLIQATEDSEVQFALDTKGGFIFPEFHFAFDGMYGVVKILELLSKAGLTLRALNLDTPKRAYVEGQVPCPWEAKGKVMRQLDKYSEDMNRELIDGVKIFQNDAWVLVLPDREKAFYHVLADAQNEAKAKKLVKEFEQRILEWIET